jgi:predicted dehydrogenase
VDALLCCPFLESHAGRLDHMFDDSPWPTAEQFTTPNHLHHEIGVAMARAGKHIWIEKPVGRNSAEVRAVAAAMAEAGVRSTVGM